MEISFYKKTAAQIEALTDADPGGIYFAIDGGIYSINEDGDPINHSQIGSLPATVAYTDLDNDFTGDNKFYGINSSRVGFNWIVDGAGKSLETRLSETGGDVYLDNTNHFTATNSFQDVGISFGKYLQGLGSVGFNWIVDGAGTNIIDYILNVAIGNVAILDDDNTFIGVNTFTNYINSDTTGFDWIKDGSGTDIITYITTGAGGSVPGLNKDNTFTGVNTFTDYINSDKAGFAWIKDVNGITLESRLGSGGGGGDVYAGAPNTFTAVNTFIANTFFGAAIQTSGIVKNSINSDFSWIKDRDDVTLEFRLQEASSLPTGIAYTYNANNFSEVNSFGGVTVYDSGSGSPISGFGWITDVNGTTLESRLGFTPIGVAYYNQQQTWTEKQTIDDYLEFSSNGRILGNLRKDNFGGFEWIIDGQGTTLEQRLIDSGLPLGLAYTYADQTWTGINYHENTSYETEIRRYTGGGGSPFSGFGWIVDSLGTTLESRMSDLAGIYYDNEFNGLNSFNSITTFWNSVYFKIPTLFEDALYSTSIIKHYTDGGFNWIQDVNGVDLESRLSVGGDVYTYADNVFTGINYFNTELKVLTLLNLGENAILNIGKSKNEVEGFGWIQDTYGTSIEDRLNSIEFFDVLPARSDIEGEDGSFRYIKNNPDMEDGLYIHNEWGWKLIISMKTKNIGISLNENLGLSLDENLGLSIYV